MIIPRGHALTLFLQLHGHAPDLRMMQLPLRYLCHSLASTDVAVVFGGARTQDLVLRFNDLGLDNVVDVGLPRSIYSVVRVAGCATRKTISGIGNRTPAHPIGFISRRCKESGQQEKPKDHENDEQNWQKKPEKPGIAATIAGQAWSCAGRKIPHFRTVTEICQT